jgi:hypothetical protein
MRVETFLRGEGFDFRDRGTDIVRGSDSYCLRKRFPPADPNTPYPELVARIIGSTREDILLLLGEGPSFVLGNGPLGAFETAYYDEHNLTVSYTNGIATKVNQTVWKRLP